MAGHTLAFHQPGHFHAALLLKAPNRRLDRSVHVYARPGPDLDRFVALIEEFNARAENPTDWDLRLHTDSERDPLERLIDQRRGTVVVVAGRNEPKLAAIERLHRAGLAVLVDKPWIVDPAGLRHLQPVTAGPPVVTDLMTGRHDVVNRICRRIVASPDLFGRFAKTSEPALEFGSVHHLCKTVDGRALIRPPWYYDVTVQGDGMVDIHSHLVDQAQWLVEAARAEVPDRDWADGDLILDGVRRWSTPVPLADFTESTGLDAFPATLSDRISHSAEPAGPVLSLGCNGRIDYRIGDVPVRQETIWRVRAPAGGGDVHGFTGRGTGCAVTVSQGPETDHRPELRLTPTGDAGHNDGWPHRLAQHVDRFQDEFPGLTAEPVGDGHRLTVPTALATPHEAMFAAVLDEFLDRVEAGSWSSHSASTIRARYTLLARAKQLADQSGP